MNHPVGITYLLPRRSLPAYPRQFLCEVSCEVSYNVDSSL